MGEFSLAWFSLNGFAFFRSERSLAPAGHVRAECVADPYRLSWLARNGEMAWLRWRRDDEWIITATPM